MTYLFRKWSGQQEIFNKFAYGVLPEHMGTLTTLCAIGIYIVHGNTIGTHLLSTYEVGYMFKKSIRLYKVVCTLRIKENVHILV
jgi:hypothetical protein